MKETDEINSNQNPVLQFVGGKISVEMQPPKLLWLKRNLKEHCWDKARHFFDLADYLVYRSTGHDVRYVLILGTECISLVIVPSQMMVAANYLQLPAI